MPEISPVPLAELTTLRTGGVPSRLVVAETRDELVAVLGQVWARGEEWLVVGGGSNLFVGDDAFEGTVVLVRTRGIRQEPSPRDGYVRLVVEAGHDWDDLVDVAVARGLAGIEAMAGIPGTVGAAPVQNIGAYGQELVDTLVAVELVDEDTGDIRTMPADGLGLGFRTSALKRHYGSAPHLRGVVASVTLELERVGDAPRPVASDQLRSALGVTDGEPVTVAWIRDRVREIRSRKGMVLDPADPDTAGAGSFFQNAVVSESFARTLPAECPRWPLAPSMRAATAGTVKVSSAWLIEHAGFAKGFRLPRSRAGLSTKHALALTNRGGATASELAELARYIRARVVSEFGLVLEPEPVLVDVEL